MHDFTVADLHGPAIRAQTGLSQADFARLIGVKKVTLRNWGPGRCKPDGPARVLPALITS